MADEGTAGRIIAVHGGKPGEGKSLIAQNLAVALAGLGASRVLVLEAEAAGPGEAIVRWGLETVTSVAGIAGRLHRFDPASLRGFFPRHASGVEVAVLAETPSGALEVTAPQLRRALELFRRAFGTVIVDGLAGWDPLTLTVLDASDLVVMVCSPDLPGLVHAREDSARYRELKFPAAKIGLVLNRADLSDALQVPALEEALPGHRVLGSVPYAPHAVEAANLRRDLLGLYPHAPFAKAVRELARRVSETDATPSAPEERPLGSRSLADAGPARTDPTQVKERIHALLLENPELRALAAEPARSATGQALLREKVEAVVTGLMALEAPDLTDREARERWVREMVDEALGLGPLEDLIRDDTVTEIMVNRRDQIYVERGGRLQLTDKHFVSDKQLMTVIERIVAPLGRRIDESQPYVDARLPDGSRVHAIIPPLALKGATLTIRKFSRRRLGVDDLARFGSLTPDMARFLGACVRGRRNLVISGGTGSGKTTLLNILAGFISEEERIVTVEDAAELNLPQPHVVTLEARPVNLEGRGAVTIRDLVRNCLRMRPDRIVVGECREGEALDMLQAMNTGHDGSLTTVHANAPKDAIGRMETMVLMSGMDLPVRAIREQIASAVHLIVQQSRLQDGSRKVTQISEVAGIEDGAVVLKDVFVFRQTGVDRTGKVTGEFKATGYIPTFVKELAARGIGVEERMFRKSG